MWGFVFLYFSLTENSEEILALHHLYILCACPGLDLLFINDFSEEVFHVHASLSEVVCESVHYSNRLQVQVFI